MALSNLFSLPTLICLGITLLLVGVVSMFFMQRLNEQNHKFASMLGLVSTMAEELKFVRSRVQILSAREMARDGGCIFEENNCIDEPINNDNTNALINVSDDEDDSDSDSEDSSDSDSDSENSSNSDTDADADEADINKTTINEKKNIKLINLIDSQESQINDEKNADLDDEKLNLDDDSISSNSSNSIDNDDVDDDVDENNDNEIVDLEGLNDDTLTLTNIDFIKSIDISTLDKAKDAETCDYKKMSIPKLRLVVVEKGLVTDSSKLKKNELYKLLEIE
jgi:hypothetical protein